MHTRSRSAACTPLGPQKGSALVARRWAVSSPTTSTCGYPTRDITACLTGEQIDTAFRRRAHVQSSPYLLVTNVLVPEDWRSLWCRGGQRESMFFNGRMCLPWWMLALFPTWPSMWRQQLASVCCEHAASLVSPLLPPTTTPLL